LVSEPLSLLERARRADQIARRLQLVQQPRRLGLWDTEQIGDTFASASTSSWSQTMRARTAIGSTAHAV
jgi:hypothetical protein